MNQKTYYDMLTHEEKREFDKKSIALRLELYELSEKFASLHRSYESGLAEMGEWLLKYADNAQINNKSDGPISWLWLLQEMQRRSG